MTNEAAAPLKRFLNTTQIKNDYSIRPAGLRWRSNTFFILSTVAVGLFTDLFLYSLVVPVLPFLLEDRIGVPESQVQSYTSGLLAVLAGSSVIFSPIAGVLADRVSTRQAPFLFGLTTLIGATILLFLATTIPVLAVARVLQGISSAVVWTIGLAICIETVGTENLGKTIGSIFSFISVGALWAPLLGGVLYEKTGVIGVLGMALGVLGVDLIMRVFMIEKKVAYRYGLKDEDTLDTDHTNANHNERGDGSENEQQSNDETQPLLGDQQEDDWDYNLPEQKSALSRTITVLPCMKHPGLLMALMLALVQATLLGSIDATVTTVARELFGFDSLQAGLLFLPLGILDLICGPIAGWLVDRYGTKPMSVFAFTFLVPAFVLLRLPQAGGTDQVILYGALLGVLGIGLAGIGAPSIVEAGAVVDKYHKANPEFFGENGPYASLYGMNSAMFNVGLTIGPELAGELKEVIGYGNMNVVLAAICGITAVLSFLYIGGKAKVVRKPKDKSFLVRHSSKRR